jgi:HK97 gp10 family phage protein
MIGTGFLQRLPRVLQRLLRDSAENIAHNARESAPQNSGALAQSIKVQERDGQVEIAATAPHAVVIELGTYRRPAQPFMRPALEAERLALRARFYATLKERSDE